MADTIEKKEYKVLDKGFVELVDIMGNDKRAVQAARVSFQKGLKSEKKDRKLIAYLMENGHESPFEHIVFTFRVKAPMFIARQWFRHRISSFNEISGRYSVINHEFYIPKEMRVQDQVNKQGSKTDLENQLRPESLDRLKQQTDDAYQTYRQLLEDGVAKEMARMVLPVNIYTLWYWTINARSLMNFINLRADSHAQWEIQEYARRIAEIFEKTCPTTYRAFVDYSYTGDLLRE